MDVDRFWDLNEGLTPDSAVEELRDRLNDLTGYPHGMGKEWSNWISVSPDEIAQLCSRWYALQPPIEYESFEVFGPTRIGGRYYRVVAYRTRSGGHGAGCEIWSSGRWQFPSFGPGGPEIMAAAPASREELLRAGIDCAPISNGYDPFSLDCECTTTEVIE